MSDRMREQFEAWVLRSSSSGHLALEKRNNGSYFYRDISKAWLGWQAGWQAAVTMQVADNE